MKNETNIKQQRPKFIITNAINASSYFVVIFDHQICFWCWGYKSSLKSKIIIDNIQSLAGIITMASNAKNPTNWVNCRMEVTETFGVPGWAPLDPCARPLRGPLPEPLPVTADVWWRLVVLVTKKSAIVMGMTSALMVPPTMAPTLPVPI